MAQTTHLASFGLVLIVTILPVASFGPVLVVNTFHVVYFIVYSLYIH